MRTRRTKLLALASTVAALAITAPGTAGAAECNGDECQGPPPAPEEVIPGTTVVEGPQNPPVHFPTKANKHDKKQQKHHQKKHRGRR